MQDFISKGTLHGFLLKLKKGWGGAYCHLGTDEHTCTWIEKCVNVFYIEDLIFFSFLMKVAWLTN